PQPCECLLPVRAADLLVMSGFSAVLGGGDGDCQEDPGYRCDRFGQRLGEGELGVERTSRLWVGTEELPGIGNPFVDEDHGGPVAAEQLVQRMPGRGTGLVASADDLVPFSAAELPGELTPDGVHLGAVVLSLTCD